MAIHPDAQRRLQAMGTGPREWKDIAQANFEAACLREFMKITQMPTRIRRQVEAAAEHHKQLHVGSFAEALPDFPLSLRVGSSAKLKESSQLYQFFKPKHFRKLVEQFLESCDFNFSTTGERATVVLLRLAYVPELMCLHDALDTPCSPNAPQLRLPIGDSESCLTLESVAGLAHRLKQYFTDYYAAR